MNSMKKLRKIHVQHIALATDLHYSIITKTPNSLLLLDFLPTYTMYNAEEVVGKPNFPNTAKIYKTQEQLYKKKEATLTELWMLQGLFFRYNHFQFPSLLSAWKTQNLKGNANINNNTTPYTIVENLWGKWPLKTGEISMPVPQICLNMGPKYMELLNWKK